MLKHKKQKISSVILSVSLFTSGYACADDVYKFDDIQKGSWYEDSINYCISNNLFKGISNTKFSPEKNITRGMFVTVLGRKIEKEEILKNTNNTIRKKFEDVDPNSYYSKYIQSAVNSNIVNGINDSEFSPDAPITREDAMAIIDRYFQNIKEDSLVYNNNDDEFKKFKDINSISDYALNAMRKLYSNGIIKGYDENIFPKKTITRAEAAQLFKNIADYENNLENLKKNLVNFDKFNIESIFVRFNDGKYIETKDSEKISAIYDLISKTEVKDTKKYEDEKTGNWICSIDIKLKNKNKRHFTIKDNTTIIVYDKEISLKEKLDNKTLETLYSNSVKEN